uniref:Uncharacterized protein n=1 Tax=Lepeophtheirus salmonis TaxID=72036 RepID=A0A0K2UNY5_LEPSM
MPIPWKLLELSVIVVRSPGGNRGAFLGSYPLEK